MDKNTLATITGDIQPTAWSASALKKMPLDELIKKYVLVEHTQWYMKCMLLYAMRFILKSNQEYGKVCQQLREDGICHEDQGTMNRYVNSGIYLEKMKISDLTKVGFKKQFVYDLAAPINADISESVTHELRQIPIEDRRKLTIEAVREMIRKAKQKLNPALEYDSVVATIEKMRDDDPAHYHEGAIDLIKQYAEESKQNISQIESELIDRGIVVPEPAQAQQAVSRLMQSILDEEPDTVKPMTRRRELILELSNMDNGAVSDDDILEDYALLDKSYRRTLLKLAELHNNRKNIIQDAIYKK